MRTLHYLFTSTLFAALALGRGLAVHAQESEPKEEKPGESSRYVTPPAAKSVEIGNFYFRRKKYNAALSRYQEAVQTDPACAPAYLGLGRVYEKIGLKMKALEAYRKYLDTLPSAKQAEEAKEAHRAIERLERRPHTPNN